MHVKSLPLHLEGDSNSALRKSREFYKTVKLTFLGLKFSSYVHACGQFLHMSHDSIRILFLFWRKCWLLVDAKTFLWDFVNLLIRNDTNRPLQITFDTVPVHSFRSAYWLIKILSSAVPSEMTTKPAGQKIHGNL